MRSFYRNKAPLLLVLLVGAAVILQGCGYLEMCSHRRLLKNTLAHQPSQFLRRELNNSANCTIYGKIQAHKPINKPIAVVAISYRFGKQEIVATSFLCGTGYYSLTIPSGQYQLLAFLDNNLDNLFSSSECIGYYQEKQFPFINIAPQTGDFLLQCADILVGTMPFTIEQPISIRLPDNYSCKRSTYNFLSYPPEVIRSFDDTLFSPQMSELGIYYPAQFADASGMYFYALQDWDERKTPILFVHGYGGTPREFRYLCEHLDTSRFAPVFFHYPSGQSLKKSARILYEAYFSGRVVDIHEKPFICIAHSMGGLVARAAINLYAERHKNPLKQVIFFSLCTPYGGVDYAEKSLEHAPEIIDSWRDIAAGSDFLRALHERALPEQVHFYLFFGFKYPKSIHVSDNSDGTIALASQLFAPVQAIAVRTHGFNETHESILTSADVAGQIASILKNEKL